MIFKFIRERFNIKDLTKQRFQLAIPVGKEHSFQGLSPKHSELLMGLSEPRTFRAGDVLFREGDAGGKLFGIHRGQVKVSKTTEDGKPFILYLLHDGDLFAESGVTFTFDAEAVTDTVCTIIAIQEVEALVYRDGAFAVDYMQWMGRMQRTTQSKFRDLLLFGKPGALASLLIRMSNTFGQPCEGGVRLTAKLTHSDLAQFIGSTRENVNRQLSAWKDRNVLSFEDGSIIIHDISQLREVCQCPTFPACPAEICRL